MRLNLPILSIILLCACQNKPAENAGDSPEQHQQVIESVGNDSVDASIETSHRKQPVSECDRYWQRRVLSNSTRAAYIDEIIAENTLTENNLDFLNALKTDTSELLTFQKVLSPVFRRSASEIGVFGFPETRRRGNVYYSYSKEMELIERSHPADINSFGQFGMIQYFPDIMDSLFEKNPQVHYYKTDGKGITEILDLGSYQNECLEYTEYAIDTTNISFNDQVLLVSPFEMDLVFENKPDLDTLIKNDYKKECTDCPGSNDLQRTFARLEGTDNVYFIYADTFPLNNELQTPSRALIFLDRNGEIIYLWYREIDLVGCSCI